MARGRSAGHTDAGFDCSHFQHGPVGKRTAHGVGALDWSKCARDGLRAKARE